MISTREKTSLIERFDLPLQEALQEVEIRKAVEGFVKESTIWMNEFRPRRLG